jgi:hypothetical protein
MKEDFDINEWLKRVSTISTETVSQYIKGDYLTHLDKDSYHVVNYKDGRVEKTLTTVSKPSVMLKDIERVFDDWGLPLNMDTINLLKKKDKRPFSDRLIFGSWISIYLNSVHLDMISDDAFGPWYSYRDGMISYQSDKEVTLEEWISSVILKQAKKYPQDTQLQRCVKLKSLLKK